MATVLPYYAALIAGILLAVMGQVLLKTGAERSPDMLAQFLSPFTVTGLAIYGLAAACYIVAIKKIPLTLAFPTVSLSYIAVALIAHFVWGEPLGLPQLAGLAFITVGIVMLHQV